MMDIQMESLEKDGYTWTLMKWEIAMGYVLGLEMHMCHSLATL